MNTLEDQLTNVLDRRGADVDVDDRLGAIVEGTNVIRFDVSRPRRWNRRLLPAAAAVALLAVGGVAVTQLGGGDEARDDGTATQPDVPEGGDVLPRPLSAVDSLAVDEWVIPTRLPDGFEFQYAADTSTVDERSQMMLYGIGASQIEQIVLNVRSGGKLSTGDVLVVDGSEWTVSGGVVGRIASRSVGDAVITIGGMTATDAELTDFLAGLVVVDDGGLPSAPILFIESLTDVGVFEVGEREFTVKADGSNGWFCTALVIDEGWGGGCASFFDPSDHVEAFQSAGSEYAEGGSEFLTNTDGMASAATASVEVDWIDGTTTSVAPQNTSDRFPDVRFWATGTTIELEPGQTAEQLADIETVVEVRAYGADGSLLATSRDGTLTVE